MRVPPVQTPASVAQETLASGVHAGSFPTIIAYDNAGVKISFSFKKNPNNPADTAVQMTASNSNSYPLTNFSLQVF